jgi:AP endonuclease-2
MNEPGPDKGKTFYLCVRPVGPGYDKGRHERPREQVDYQYKCSSFMWASDAASAAASSGVAGPGAASQGQDVVVGL